MIQLTNQINTPTQVTLVSLTSTTGQSVPGDLVFIKDGHVLTQPPAVTFSDLGMHGMYSFTFTLSQTGSYVMYAYGDIQAQIQVVTKSMFTFLQNIEDEALGSWQWDKVAGTLVMLRQDGTNLANFTVVDSLTEANRERTT
jgi:hypothetical protein